MLFDEVDLMMERHTILKTISGFDPNINIWVKRLNPFITSRGQQVLV